MPKWVSLFFSENVYHQQLQKEKSKRPIIKYIEKGSMVVSTLEPFFYLHALLMFLSHGK